MKNVCINIDPSWLLCPTMAVARPVIGTNKAVSDMSMTNRYYCSFSDALMYSVANIKCSPNSILRILDTQKFVSS